MCAEYLKEQCYRIVALTLGFVGALIASITVKTLRKHGYTMF